MENPITQMLQLIRDRGWTQHQYENKKGSLCIYGAHDQLGPRSHATLQIIRQTIKEQFPKYESSGTIIVSFNDSCDRRIADIEMVLEKAAVKYDEQHGL